VPAKPGPRRGHKLTDEVLAEPFAFIVELRHRLWLAPRGSEHVACAAGLDVLAAGEMGFLNVTGRWRVREVTQPLHRILPGARVVASGRHALDHGGIPHPHRYTGQVTFRRCMNCRCTNIVRDEVFVCALCDKALPTHWNFGD
jgi:hypothetical protein